MLRFSCDSDNPATKKDQIENLIKKSINFEKSDKKMAKWKLFKGGVQHLVLNNFAHTDVCVSDSLGPRRPSMREGPHGSFFF